MQRYTNDKGTQIVLSLLKAHGIKKVIASPGTTNIALVASMQLDPWFEMYSAVDERGAAYMACGMAAASGEPVVITCTGATASRNYYPGMTEAYYRKLPVLAITGSHGREKIGNLEPQVIDRSVIAKDACKLAVYIDKISDEDDERRAVLDVNKAILELTRNGGGPVLIDLKVGIKAGFDSESIPHYRKIERFHLSDKFPDLPMVHRVAVYIGSHEPFNDLQTKNIELFCENNNAVVIADITSNYHGKWKVNPQLLFAQHIQKTDLTNVDLLIHIGETSGDYYSLRNIKPKIVWRVSEDGEIKDFFGTLTSVFEMPESDFFKYYSLNAHSCLDINYYKDFIEEIDKLQERVPELPLSNMWVAHTLLPNIPSDSVIHCARANSARAMNLTNWRNLHNEFRSNVGGFGIDGPISTTIGSALVNGAKIHILITGDLAFMYDINSLANHHLPSNLRIILINNGCGTEFCNYDHPGSQWGSDAAPYIAAAGHLGNKSKDVVKNYVSSLGMHYFQASTKDEVQRILSSFISGQHPKGSILEIFTDPELESRAIQMLRTIQNQSEKKLSDKINNKVKSIFRIK